jgi:hypothetical protein
MHVVTPVRSSAASPLSRVAGFTAPARLADIIYEPFVRSRVGASNDTPSGMVATLSQDNSRQQNFPGAMPIEMNREANGNSSSSSCEPACVPRSGLLGRAFACLSGSAASTAQLQEEQAPTSEQQLRADVARLEEELRAARATVVSLPPPVQKPTKNPFGFSDRELEQLGSARAQQSCRVSRAGWPR